MQEGLLQFLQGGEFAFVKASEVLGIYAQVVGGLLAVISAGIAQQADESEGQQKLSGLMQVSQLPRRWPCWEGLLDTTLIITRPRQRLVDPIPLCRVRSMMLLGEPATNQRHTKKIQTTIDFSDEKEMHCERLTANTPSLYFRNLILL